MSIYMCVCDISTHILTPESCKIDVNVYIFIFFLLGGVFFVVFRGLEEN